MDIVLWIIWFGTYFPGAVLFEIYIMHMFQQNSYKPREYREWLQVTGNIGRMLGKIVLGKYLALATVLFVPTAFMGILPLFLMQGGEFQMGVSYASVLGFFLYGCLALAVGLFLSSLTESVVIAAVLHSSSRL